MDLPVMAFLAMVLFSAIVAQTLARRFNFPTVTAYVIIGALLGGSFLGQHSPFRDTFLLSHDTLLKFQVVSDLALGLVAFSIGAELEWRRLRKLGASILAITLGESLGAFFLVTVAVGIVLGSTGNWPMALVLGAIASATAPAATVSVLRQYRAKGPLTDTILAVVGIDDAIALIIYQFAATMAHVAYGEVQGGVWLMILLPLVEVGISLLVGFLCGLAAWWMLMRSRTGDPLLFASVTAIVFTLAVAALINDLSTLRCSPLLTVMAMAATLVNRSPMLKNRVEQVIRSFVPLFFAFFFILGGAHLDLLALPAVGLVALVYLVARTGGKVGGAMLGAKVGRADPVVRKYIGYSLIPQVGVAVALAYSVSVDFAAHPKLVSLAMNVLLFTTLVTEIIGPLMTRYALLKSGEGQTDIPARR